MGTGWSAECKMNTCKMQEWGKFADFLSKIIPEL